MKNIIQGISARTDDPNPTDSGKDKRKRLTAKANNLSPYIFNIIKKHPTTIKIYEKKIVNFAVTAEIPKTLNIKLSINPKRGGCRLIKRAGY